MFENIKIFLVDGKVYVDVEVLKKKLEEQGFKGVNTTVDGCIEAIKNQEKLDNKEASDKTREVVELFFEKLGSLGEKADKFIKSDEAQDFKKSFKALFKSLGQTDSTKESKTDKKSDTKSDTK